ncbi:MAG: FAD:protein FMN transferase [Candidatus Promineifilaceae bacterium]
MNLNEYPDRWHQRSFYAMGCQMAVWLEYDDAETAAQLLIKAEEMFRYAESRLSRFDPTSELSLINAWPGTWKPVSELMWAMVTQALFMARETDGLFDPTQLTALETAGYVRSFELIGPVNDGDIEEDVTRYGQWQAIQLNAGERAIWTPPGVKLDFGGIAKGFTAQEFVDFLAEWGPCLVDSGGDLGTYS